MSSHSVEYGQQLSHAGGERNLLRLAARQQALIEALDDGVIPGGHESGHVRGPANVRTSTPDLTSAAEQTAVSVQGSYTDQCGNFLTAELAQFGQVCQEHRREDRAHSRNAPEKVVPLPPDWAGANNVAKPALQVQKLALQPADMGLDVRPHLPRGQPG